MINIRTIKEILELIPTLNKKHVLLLKDDRHILWCVYHKNDDWIFRFDDFSTYSFNTRKGLRGLVGNLEKCLDTYSMNGSYICVELDNMENMCYELRQDILKRCVDSLMNPKFMIGDKEYESNLPKIIKEVNDDLGKVIDFGYDNGVGILTGVSVTTEDYYYVYIAPDNKIYFNSCVGGYKVIDKTPESLKDLIDDRKKLSEIMFGHFGNSLCTEVCIVSI